MPLLAALGCRAPGFSVEPAASPARLGPLSGLSFDSRGRPIVFREGGLARLLVDQNGDGIFDTERVLTSQVTAVRGVWFEGRQLYLLGNGADGKYGLYRLEDRDRDDDMNTVECLAELAAPGEGTHELRRGPDGALLVLHGAQLLRWNEERRDLTPFAGGFINPSHFAFNREGEAFVLDINARLLHVIPGGDYAPPPYRFDVLPVLRAASVAGLEFYQHRVYPAVYRDTLFQAEGADGRITVRRLSRSGATYRVEDPPVAEFHSIGAALISDLKVGPDGFVYFTTMTPGGLYRIRYRGDTAEEPTLVRKPQPFSAWGQAALQREHDLLESRWGEELEALVRSQTAPAADRVQALILLQRYGPKPVPALLKALLADADPRIRSTAVYGDPASLADRDAFVRRRAAEALATQFDPAVYPLLADPDRFVRFAARLALEQMPREEWRQRVLDETNPGLAIPGMLALIHTGTEREPVLTRLLPMLDSLDALRLFTLASAGVTDPLLRRRATEILLPQFPAADENRNRELASALAWCGGTEVIDKLLAELKKGGPLQAHYAQCLRSIADGWTPPQREALRKSGVTAGIRTAQDIFDRQMARTAPVSSLTRGRTLFLRNCAACHRYGPDPAAIAKRLNKAELLEAILWPSRQVDPKFRAVVLELADGSALEGMIVREDEKRLLIKTASEPNPISILRTRITSQRTSEKSIMPEGLLDSYDPAAIASLLAYLQSAAGE